MCGVQVFQDTATKEFVGEAVLRRLGPDGTEIWTKNFSDINSTDRDLNFYSLIKTQDGNLAVAGVSDYGYQNSYKNGFLAKMDTDGNIVWQKTFGGPHAQSFKQVIETSDGGFLLAGGCTTTSAANSSSLYAVKTGSQGELEWEYTHPNDPNDPIRHQAYTAVEDEFGNYILGGSIHQILHNSTDFYVVKLDLNGNFIWETIVDHQIGGQTREVFIKNNGNILACGWHAPNMMARPMIIELDPEGTFIEETEVNYSDLIREWAYSFQKDEMDVITMLSFDSENNYRVTRFDDANIIIWSQFVHYNTSTSAEANGIFKTADNGFICTGTSIIDGGIEAVVFKLNEEGTFTSLSAIRLDSGIGLFPVPANQYVTIQLNGHVSKSDILLLDSKGRAIRKYARTTKILDVSTLTPGLYLLRLELPEGHITKKLVIE